MAKRQYLDFQRSSRSEQSNQPVPDQFAEIYHPVVASPDSLVASRIRFATGTSVRALERDLHARNIRTKTRQLKTGAIRGGIPIGRGSLFYLLSNHSYIGEVKYKGDIQPGEQPSIMVRELFVAVQQKLQDQWSHRTVTRNASDHLVTGLLYDDIGHRMVPTHSTKAGIRYRYYISSPHFEGNSRTAAVGNQSHEFLRLTSKTSWSSR